MTDTPPKPKRRRWLWPVAGLVLAVILVRSLRPKPDQRFVGRWVASSGAIEHIYQLNPDGSGRFLQYRHFMGYEPWHRLTWWIKEGQLVIRKSSLSVMAPVEDLTIVAYTTLGGMPNRRESSFNIRECENGLSLQKGTGFEQLIKLEARQGGRVSNCRDHSFVSPNHRPLTTSETPLADSNDWECANDSKVCSVTSGMTDETRRASRRSLVMCRATRWLLSVVLAVGLYGAWSQWPSESTVSRGKKVSVGQTKAEVALIMGDPRMTYQKGRVDQEFYGPKTRAQLEIQAFLSTYLSSTLFPTEQFPVGIEYGTDGRVQTIRVVPGAN